ncbi:MAG: helix-turn-helix domain-containing protein [Candidatus Omnitrophica bacterium]|nr:helix-turn-helix domain-containing protein [Candidatus Omnitrophota bacterium]
MGKIYSIKARERFEIMNLLSSGVITERQAAEQLNLSIRQIQRLKKRFIIGGRTIESLLFHWVHRQINKIPESIAKKIIILKKQGSHRSCQHISELLPPVLSKGEKQWFIEWGKPHFHLSHQTIRNILKQANLYENIYEKVTPATRFEMENFGELVQMDTSSFRGLCGYKRIYLILTLDDYSRTILSGKFFLSDTVYHKRATRLEQLNNLFQSWINWYNNNWRNRDTGCTPEERKTPSVKDTNLDGVFCLKDTRRVDKTNSFSYEGFIYKLNYKYNLVGSKVELHIHPGNKIRVFHKGTFIQEILYQKHDILSLKLHILLLPNCFLLCYIIPN